MALAKFAVSIAANYQNYFLHLEFIEVNFLHRKDYSKELESAVMFLGVQFSVLHYFLRKIIILSQSSEVFQIGKNFLPEELSCSFSSHHNSKKLKSAAMVQVATFVKLRFLQKILILSNFEVVQIQKDVLLPEELSCSSSSHHNFKSVMVLDFTQTNSEHSTKVALVMVTISTQN